MKYIVLVFILAIELFGSVIKSPVVTVNNDETEVTIKIDKIDVGMSGFIVHKISQNRTTILKNAIVASYDKDTQVAKLMLSEYTELTNGALPSGKWHVEVGDYVVLAFGYTRGLLIAPNEDIYYRVTKSTKLQWVHPDIFATILSFNGHPTPLREDFTKMSETTSVGLVFIFLEEFVYTADARSFKILAVSEAKLPQGSTNLPFYTRVPEIDANWWGEGSSELESYEPYYYELLVNANPENNKLREKFEAFKTKE
ncbi:plasminogen-binding N-terminal domain-containing protein [Candidatus Sulfurimonas marisnigri]|uniref:Plasminogen-binding N-terminal domain-containing protein n=1 Tax=Candidatus Sulfurimonas marisnigri TaxID=2740405 RepID=A0A7S7M0X0_9BACT|nr:plasminogen-binding N-terminal domain-containing protein [Candidatus Sulfurimonas marisnigri]QOY54970.1 plasminogen-binding N-terminal domain-containing protein [Candidatus Sulfurimonas marisnigri]